MPEISRFFGIVIKMYWNEWEQPHFHAWYAGHRVQIEIETLELLKGHLPPRALRLVIEWAWMHRGELAENWTLMRNGIQPKRIPPLE